MENMNKGLTVPKWVLIVQSKISQGNAPELICPSPKVLDFNEKRLHWASVVREWHILQIMILNLMAM